MTRDYGFELPDKRYEYATKEGTVSVVIVRHWQQHEDDRDEPTFKVSFDLCHKYDNGDPAQWINLPIGIDESKAIASAKTLWEEDEEATREIQDMRAEEEAERRMGA